MNIAPTNEHTKQKTASYFMTRDEFVASFFSSLFNINLNNAVYNTLYKTYPIIAPRVFVNKSSISVILLFSN